MHPFCSGTEDGKRYERSGYAEGAGNRKKEDQTDILFQVCSAGCVWRTGWTRFCLSDSGTSGKTDAGALRRCKKRMADRNFLCFGSDADRGDHPFFYPEGAEKDREALGSGSTFFGTAGGKEKRIPAVSADRLCDSSLCIFDAGA